MDGSDMQGVRCAQPIGNCSSCDQIGAIADNGGRPPDIAPRIDGATAVRAHAGVRAPVLPGDELRDSWLASSRLVRFRGSHGVVGGCAWHGAELSVRRIRLWGRQWVLPFRHHLWHGEQRVWLGFLLRRLAEFAESGIAEPGFTWADFTYWSDLPERLHTVRRRVHADRGGLLRRARLLRCRLLVRRQWVRVGRSAVIA